MNKKNNFRFLLIVYIFMVVIMLLIGLMGIIGVRTVYLNPEEYDRIIFASITATVLAALGSIVIVIYMNRYIKKKLKGLRGFAERISEYDFTEDVDGSGNDAFGKTIKAINDAQFKVRETMEQLKSDVDSISDSSRDSSISIRRSYEQIEALNVKILGFIEQIDEDAVGNRKMWKIKNELEDTVRELSAISQYLNQIAVTAEYQHEISDRYYKQLDRFKL
ncbi:MAG: methyl-accepting chemotaxis protein [Eubacterium sp.]|nr:methyl-accepting chemotaxis protein [Eubacterium sp.]